MCLPPVLLFGVPVWDVHVVLSGVVVLVRVVGLQVTPVLPPVQVVSDVEVLVPVLQGLMLMMTLCSRHPAHLFRDRARPGTDRTPRGVSRTNEPLKPGWGLRRPTSPHG
jgi:hypothetical protein